MESRNATASKEVDDDDDDDEDDADDEDEVGAWGRWWQTPSSLLSQRPNSRRFDDPGPSPKSRRHQAELRISELRLGTWPVAVCRQFGLTG
ncbi:hypothetical protein M5D96_003141 [Drosophila gunungcola]|uniref:Uncharacterized protein n=1 Tax=Drosophila gunungcola TaxID=103775 RepID=A0A9P9Z1B0_9MUSC|nr:hypothetical protein M5D96_003141 [Drosophila gunungcola]